MPNPILPAWEYIPDGEPRVFGSRVYLYGSHDRPGSQRFCDFKLRVWSAPLDDLENWVCHGDSFHTRADLEHSPSVDWTDNELYAPDVVEKDGNYYLYFYILMAKGGVAISERPEGPFRLLSTYTLPPGAPEDFCESGIFVDPGVLVDDDGRVYVYCGYLRSYMIELNPENMHEVIDGSYIDNIIPVEEPFNFFEACSPRKIGEIYYLIYSPKRGSCLAYAWSTSPRGPFAYGGVIIDNGLEYPGGNNHGSLMQIGEQWYIFYHRMTNNTIMSRRACVEPVTILPDGSIPQVEMTSLGFSKALSPYRIQSADRACVLTGGNFIREESVISHPVIHNTAGSVIGFKYFDFGEVSSNASLRLTLRLRPRGNHGRLSIMADHPTDGQFLGSLDLDGNLVPGQWTTCSCIITYIPGRHSIYICFSEFCESKDEIADVESLIFTLDNY